MISQNIYRVPMTVLLTLPRLLNLLLRIVTRVEMTGQLGKTDVSTDKQS